MEGNRYLELFGKQVPIRTIGCSNNGNKPIYFSTPRCNLFIQTTNLCNANCAFCEYHGAVERKFDIIKLGEIIKEIHSKATIGKINFTGGEPTLNLNKFDKIANTVADNIDWNRKPEITLNSNGIHLIEMLDYEWLVDFIGLSRHHYDDIKNEEIFGCNSVASKDKIKNFQSKVKNKKLIQLRCNLIAGQIDSYEKIINYLNHAIDIDVSDCGFVTLMKINDFCNTHQVDFPSLIKDSDDLLEVAKWIRLDEIDEKSELCCCSNYIYSSDDGRFCRFYRRNFCNCNLNAGQLTYDGEYLRFGFGGEIIY